MKTKKFVAAIAALSILLFINAASYAQALPSKAERKKLMRAFNQNYGNRWNIVWNEATGTPESILGHKIRSYRGTPTEIALALLRDEKGMFGITDVDRDLHLEKTRHSVRGGTRLVFTQKYNGIPILASGYLVAVDNDGGIYYVSGSYFPEVNLNTSPSLSSSDVTSIIQSDLPGSTIETITTPILLIQAEVDKATEKYTLVYQAEATTSLPQDIWRYTIDANTGMILHKTSMIEKINGNGDVYQTNPLRGGVVNRTLHRLRDISPRMLDGDNVIVINDSTSEASSPSGTFVYASQHTHFDEVMAYYHSDEFEAWLIGKGMETNRVARVTIHTEDPDLNRYAATLSASRIIWFSDGEAFPGLRNPTKEAAVITHEYMHAVSETYNALTQNDQAEAMDESYSDYFGLAYTTQFISTSTIGEYIDEPGGLVYRRELINTHTFSEYSFIDTDGDGTTEEHDRCVIFSGALWDFRRDGDVSSSTADELVLESLNNLDNSPSFLKGRNALKAAANASGYSHYNDDIDAAFLAHGIYEPLSVYISGSDILDYGEQGTWTANAFGGVEAYNCEWRYRWYGTGSWIGPVGTAQNYSRTMWEDDFELQVKVTSGSDVAYDTYYVMNSDMQKRADNGTDVQTTLIPDHFVLQQNFPNPFNSETEIRFGLPEEAYVQLVVIDLLGRAVRKLVDGNLKAGHHSAIWDGKDNSGNDVPSGIYFYQIVAGIFRNQKKVALVK